MGMYPTYEEVRPDTLARMLAAPDDASLIDGLLFDVRPGEQSYRRSHQATFFEPDSGVVLKPLHPLIVMTSEQMHLLGTLELGKHPDWDAELSFRYFLQTADMQDHKASRLLDALEMWETQGVHVWAQMGVEPAELPVRQPRVEREGRPAQTSFSTEVVCYGIPGYRTPEDLLDVWQRIEQVIERFPAQVEGCLARGDSEIGAVIHYYHGCAMRGSADLYMMH